ncbi:hypothetical protein Patl1_09738 [Pistacia atlantica]|uniref:Uncharacterized protein n=1 Tax=Pistacia atlantica TaxID=434234 RepID=A0ACC1A4A9_9ROSI|nr:hypothetical protein Patl1_09738 [Pistacia atlantica]
MPSLQLSYDELPTHLKQCLLCFSVYPEDIEIQAEQLVHWWAGEGLIQGNDTWTATELGYEYLSELASRCLIDVEKLRDYDGRVYSCKMHDLIRDMTIKISKDEGFCNFDEKGKQKPTDSDRWLGFMSDMDPNLLKETSNLRALLMMSNNRISFGRDLKLPKSLRVLDLSNNKLDVNQVEDLWNWICSLKRLACLNLSGATLKEVPRFIRKLRNLQILIMRNCSNLSELHPSITNLKKLIVLDVGSSKLQYIPNGLGKLIHLQELSGFRVFEKANKLSCRFLELQNLKQLRVLRMNINAGTKISEDERNVLSELENLKVLAIDAENCTEESVSKMLDLISPPPKLEELYLKRYSHEILPKWINPDQLSSLQYLCLEDGNVVRLLKNPTHESEDRSGSTWALTGLHLSVMKSLDLDWQNVERDMPLLRYAFVSQCYNLKNLPSSSQQSFPVRLKIIE